MQTPNKDDDILDWCPECGCDELEVSEWSEPEGFMTLECMECGWIREISEAAMNRALGIENAHH